VGDPLERIAVIGIGRIGLCLALNLERVGYDVLGVDQNAEYVRQVGEKTLRSPEPGVEEALKAACNFQVSDHASSIRDFAPDLLFVAVDTPTAEGGGYDHSHVDRVLVELFSLEPWQPRVELALVCTTFPGYCDSKSTLARVHSYALSYNPGFIAHGTILRDQRAPDQVLIGEADAIAGEKLANVYLRMCINRRLIHRMTPLSAEIAKLATNCALTMKIAFANAIGDLATSAGASPDQILAVVGGDSRIGSKFLKYGFGYGGACLTRDNRALNLFASETNHELLLAIATDEMNRRHLEFQVNEYLRAYPEDESIHFESVTYKPGTEILEESQPLALAVQLARAGRRVVIHESPAVMAVLHRQFGNLFEYEIRGEEDSRHPDPLQFAVRGRSPAAD
jgi:UDPglucose 6-dehydrogenase